MYDEVVLVGNKFIFIGCDNDESRRPQQKQQLHNIRKKNPLLFEL